MNAGRPRRRAGRAEAALAIGSIALFLAAAELVARIVDLRPAGGRALENPAWLGERWMLRADYRRRMAEEGILARYYDLYEWDRRLFFRLRPNVHLELVDVMAPPALRHRTRWSVHTGERGFRTADFGDRPRPGVTRVAVLGDSSTFGWGVEHFEAYPERLARDLAALWKVAPERVETLNLGVPGYSSFQGRVLLEQVALPLAPDVVVWSYLSNDGSATGESDEAAYARRMGPIGALLEWLHASRAFEALESWLGVARSRLRPVAAPDPHDPEGRNVANYDVARRNVDAAVAAARGAGVPIVLLGQCVRGVPAAVLRDAAQAAGVPHLDGSALLDGAIRSIAAEPRFEKDRERLAARWGQAELARHAHWLAFLPDGCHPNPLGHRLVAQALAAAVAQALPEPAR
jgi:lysophospholipase L1-like esterase